MTVKKLAKLGRHADGGGLYLFVGKDGRKSWVFRYVRGTKTTELGLGGEASLSLTEARVQAAELRRVLAEGGDPKVHRARQVNARQLEDARSITFKDAAAKYIEAHKAGWRNAKHAAQWEATLATYAAPEFGNKSVADVGTEDVLEALKPVWQAKPETASRLRGRIEAILDYARARHWRTGENPARWRGNLALLLPARSKVRRVEHHAAMPYADVPALMVTLEGSKGMAPLALRLLILTAARTGEAIGMQWSEVNLAERLWTVPAERMKAKRDHRVPLNDQAMAVMEGLLTDGKPASTYVFPGNKGLRHPLSNMALLATLRRLKHGDVTAHGFRSSFRDWAAEKTASPREVIEAALAHVVGSKTEMAYLRSDVLDKRRALMTAWGEYCAGQAGGTVVALRRAG